MQSCVKQGLTGSQSGTAKLSRNWTGGVQGEATDRLVLPLRLVALPVLSRGQRCTRKWLKTECRAIACWSGPPIHVPDRLRQFVMLLVQKQRGSSRIGQTLARISVPSSRENWAGCWLTSTCKPGFADGLMHLRRELGEGLPAAAHHFRRPDYRAKIILQRTD